MTRHTKLNTRILSVVLSAALICTVSIETTYGAEVRPTALGESSIATIRSFDGLELPFFPVEDSDNTYSLTAKHGAELADLNLPDKLAATVERTTTVSHPKEDEIMQDSDETAEIAQEDLFPTPLPETMEEEQVVTAIEMIPVTWHSDLPYDTEADGGSRIFTARFAEGYSLGEGVIMPKIYVMTGVETMLADGTYDIADGPIDITGAGTYTITGKSTENTIIISANSGEIYITLDNVKIENGDVSPFKTLFNSSANVTITLQGDNVLSSTGNSDAGLQKYMGSGMLTIIGNGSLTATAVNGGGIGGGYNGSTENITIAGNAKVTARSSGTGAGIGGGYGGKGTKITIRGNAVVNAYSGAGLSNGAGIGGGNIKGDGGDILITDNAIVTAVAGNRGAGIGGGYGGNGYNIVISGNALVHATGGIWSAGIGGGNADSDAAGGSGSGNSVSGNAVVFATGAIAGDPPVQGMTQTGGILFEGTDGTMVGDVTLNQNVDIPAGHSVTVPHGNTLTNEGVLSVHGDLEYGGTNGDLVNNGTLNMRPAGTTLTVKKNAQPVTEAIYGDAVDIDVVAQSSVAKSRMANTGMVDFYIDNGGTHTPIGSSIASFTGGVATASLTISLAGGDWGAGTSPKILYAEYGGTVPSGTPGSIEMLDSIATGSLTVNPAILSVNGVTAVDRKYDGTTNVSLSGGTLFGVILGETVAVPTSGIIPNPSVGTGKTVIPQLIPRPQNYTLIAPTGLTVNITPADPVVTFSVAQETLLYTGIPAIVTPPDVTLLNRELYVGEVLYSFEPSAGGGYLSGLPTDAGTYQIRASIAAAGNYAAADGTNELTLTITSTTPTLTINSYADTLYTGQALADPTDITSDVPNPIVTYAWYADSGGAKGDKLSGAPKDAGVYHVEGTIPASGNATAVTSGAVRFTVGKAAAPGAQAGSLTVSNNEALVYSFDLRRLLTPSLSFGGETYEIKTATASLYYDTPTGSAINGSILTVLVKAVNSSVEGIVGTVTVTVKSRNYEDMDGLLTVSSMNKPTPPAPPTGGSSSGGGDGGSYIVFDNSEYIFWMGVKDKIDAAHSADVLKVNARAYDMLPVNVMDALRKNSGVTLVISRSVGEDITIPAGKAQMPEAGRTHYPLPLLAELYKGITFVQTPIETDTKQDKQSIKKGKLGYIRYPDGEQTPVTGGSIVTVDALEAPPTAPEVPEVPEVLRNESSAQEALTAALNAQEVLPDASDAKETSPTVPGAIALPDKEFEQEAFERIPDTKDASILKGVLIAVITAVAPVVVVCGLWLWNNQKEDSGRLK